MKVVAFTEKNLRYKKLDYPQEDSFKYFEDMGLLVAVADGITRDSKGMEKRPNGKDDEEVFKKTAENYPRPSPAKKAADLFCDSFIGYMKEHEEKSIREVLEQVNKKICELNKKVEIDYLENDFWACVGVVGRIIDNVLYYGYIADCGVCVFGENGELKFRTEDEGPDRNRDIEEDMKRKYDVSFELPKGRKTVRREYRNNTKNPLSYGAFTGEESALEFVRIGEIQLEQGDYILFYTDGMPQIIFSEDFNISRCFDNLKEYMESNSGNIKGGEGTLVAVKL